MIQFEGRRKAAGRGHRRAAPKVDSSITVTVERSYGKAQAAALALAGCLAALAGVAGDFTQTRRSRSAGNRLLVFRRLLAGGERRRVAIAGVSLTTRSAVESGPSSSSSLLDMIDA